MELKRLYKDQQHRWTLDVTTPAGELITNVPLASVLDGLTEDTSELDIILALNAAGHRFAATSRS